MFTECHQDWYTETETVNVDFHLCSKRKLVSFDKIHLTDLFARPFVDYGRWEHLVTTNGLDLLDVYECVCVCVILMEKQAARVRIAFPKLAWALWDLASFLRYKSKLYITSTSHSMRWLIHYTNIVYCLLFFASIFIFCTNDLFQHQSLKNSKESHEFWMALWRRISVQNSKWKMPSYNEITTTNLAIGIKNSFQSRDCFRSVASSNWNNAIRCILCAVKLQSSCYIELDVIGLCAQNALLPKIDFLAYIKHVT